MTTPTSLLARLAVEDLPAPKDGGALVLPALLDRLLALSASGSLPVALPLQDLTEALTARAELGRRRYGQDLRAGDGRGLADGAQEDLDGLMYAQRDAMGGLLTESEAGEVVGLHLRALAIYVQAEERRAEQSSTDGG